MDFEKVDKLRKTQKTQRPQWVVQLCKKCDHFELIHILLCAYAIQSEAEDSYRQLLIG